MVLTRADLADIHRYRCMDCPGMVTGNSETGVRQAVAIHEGLRPGHTMARVEL